VKADRHGLTSGGERTLSDYIAVREDNSRYGHLLTDAEANFLFWEIFEIMFDPGAYDVSI